MARARHHRSVTWSQASTLSSGNPCLRANVTTTSAQHGLPLRALLHADLTAMAKGEPLNSGLHLLLRLLVHARWRAVVTFRLAQRCMRGRATRPLGLWLADRVLAFSGPELEPASTIAVMTTLTAATSWQECVEQGN